MWRKVLEDGMLLLDENQSDHILHPLMFLRSGLLLKIGEFKMKNERKNKFTFTTEQITILAVLIALSLALSQIGSIPIGTSNRLSFGFVINAIIGILYGPWVAGFAGVAEDLLKSFLFGAGGPFFIGFTLTAFVGSFIYGLFLHRKKITWKHVLGAVLFNTIISNLVLNTLWVNLLWETPILVLLSTRIPQNLIMGPIRFIVIYLITQNKQLKRIFNRYATY